MSSIWSYYRDVFGNLLKNTLEGEMCAIWECFSSVASPGMSVWRIIKSFCFGLQVQVEVGPGAKVSTGVSIHAEFIFVSFCCEVIRDSFLKKTNSLMCLFCMLV